MVTDGHQRPEIPKEDSCPSPLFPGVEEYIELMKNCWKQVRPRWYCFQFAGCISMLLDGSGNNPSYGGVYRNLQSGRILQRSFRCCGGFWLTRRGAFQ